MRHECADGNEAAAAVAYAQSERGALYTISHPAPTGDPPAA